MNGFLDRVDAGRRLAVRLEHLRGQDIVVLGLPRGGVPVAAEVARHLGAPLDVIVVRKLGVPDQPEVAMGAIGEGGFRFLDRELAARAMVYAADIQAVEKRERVVLDARVSRLRTGRERLDLGGRVAVIVDDGMATGATARAACDAARHLEAARVVLAVPVAPPDVAGRIPLVDELVSVLTPTSFRAVGHYYQDFSPTSDDEVVALLDAASRGTQRPNGV